MARFDSYEQKNRVSDADTVLILDGAERVIKQAAMEAITANLQAAMEDYIRNMDFLSTFKDALIACFEHVAWVDTDGKEYYDALYEALYSVPIELTASFVQGSQVIYNTDTLDSLRRYLTVTVTYVGGKTSVIDAYTLSGTLTPGNSTIVVTYGNLSTSFIAYVTRSQASLSAVFDSGTDVIRINTPLDNLKQYLVVTYKQSQTETGTVLPSDQYTLSGTLSLGTSTITVSYGGVTTTFTVQVEDIVYLSKFDFRQSLVDQMGLFTPVLAANTGSGYTAPTRDSEGIHFTEATQFIDFGEIDPVGKTFEYDIASLSFAGDTSHHVRLMMHHNGVNGMSPFIWRSGYGWSGYGFSKNSGTTKTWYNNVWSGLGGTDAASINQLSGKTIKLVFESTGESTSTAVSVYINNVFVERKIGLYFGTVGSRNCEQFTFGALSDSGAQDSGDQCFNLTLAGMRIYANDAA